MVHVPLQPEHAPSSLLVFFKVSAAAEGRTGPLCANVECFTRRRAPKALLAEDHDSGTSSCGLLRKARAIVVCLGLTSSRVMVMGTYVCGGTATTLRVEGDVIARSRQHALPAGSIGGAGSRQRKANRNTIFLLVCSFLVVCASQACWTPRPELSRKGSVYPLDGVL